MGTLFSLSQTSTSFWLDVSETALLIFGLILVVGVIGESAKSDKWKKWHRTFELMVILSVAGEFFADGGIFVFSRHLQTISDAELKIAITESGDAKKSAEDAARAALTAQRSAASANTELGKAEKREAILEKEALSFKHRLNAQGSRSRLLFGKENRERLVERLKPFAGQKIEIRLCRDLFTPTFIDREATDLWMFLRSILSDDSKWIVNPLALANCGGAGLWIEVNSKASEPTIKAANELLKALKEVPFAIGGDKVSISDSPRQEQPKTFDCGTTSNCENKEVIFPPLGYDTIVLTVAAHPL